ncbi:endochitinase [Mycena alexandri]|uniref:Endochitinase n=1 Tax=Mycena alexandri TaxID=1745969 RepID=A0AAD6TDY6_9AGAR|nr:endochitinase [Mycena alexandri]
MLGCNPVATIPNGDSSAPTANQVLWPFIKSHVFLSLLALLPTSVLSSQIATAWFAGWHIDADPSFSISKVNWEKYDHLILAFGETIPTTANISLEGSGGEEALSDFVTAAHSNNVKACIGPPTLQPLRIGLTAFVNTILEHVTEFDLDGLDFDWEAPNNQGIGCNKINVDDTANFLEFMKELRSTSNKKRKTPLILSAATGTAPFTNNPLTDVTEFSQVLDYVAIMAYDINGPWGTETGPNAPLDDSCAPPAFQKGSVISAVDTWEKAGMPLNQIVLGVASYEHSFRVTKANAFNGTSSTELALYPPFDASNRPVGDAWDGIAGDKNECGIVEPQGGVIDFWGLIQQGYLNADGTPKNGVPYLFDNCTQTPYVYNETTEVLISFDNAESFAAKGDYIKSQGLRGFAMWEAGGDSNDILLDSIRKAAGLAD